jgi:DNA repair exonuclease SbcCD nuclease subunit
VKLIFATDLHIGRQPPQRTDEYHAAMLAKLNRLVEYSNKEKYDYFILGGDLFDRPQVEPSVLNDLYDVFFELDCKIFYVVGEHDTYGHAEEGLRNSSLSLLQTMMGPDRMICLNPAFVDGTRPKSEWTFHGIHCWNKPKTQAILQGACPNTIVVAHTLLTPKEMPYDTFPIPSITTGGTPLVLCGDFHDRFLIRQGSTTFVNPGPLGRRQRTDAAPHVVLAESPKSGSEWNVRLVPVRCEDAHWQELVVPEGTVGVGVDLAEFAERLNSFGQEAGDDIYSHIDRVGQAEKVDPEVLGLIGKMKDQVEG